MKLYIAWETPRNCISECGIDVYKNKNDICSKYFIKSKICFKRAE